MDMSLTDINIGVLTFCANIQTSKQYDKSISHIYPS